MTNLSVNINKFATLRNARGGNLPDLIKAAVDCERFGAQGITVHPRPDERHIRYQDVRDLKPVLSTEFNMEGYPSLKFIELVLEIKPAQCTLVPDVPDAITSDQGWDTIKHGVFLKEIIALLHKAGIRVSLFTNPIEQFIEGAAKAGADRVELYTGPYARIFQGNPQKAIEPYIACANFTSQIGMGLNAGHDLNLQNLKFL